MAFNNVPANGWPQIKDLEKLDALAKQIDNMPTFTSNDRAFLADLPAYPVTDGKRVLTATTDSGDTELSYEEIPSELPADPETDGVKVLTATTESVETTKSWEEPESSTWNYSTSEVNTGQKWIDGSDIYCKVVVYESALSLPYNSWVDLGFDILNLTACIRSVGIGATGACVPLCMDRDGTAGMQVLNIRNTTLNFNTFILEYTRSSSSQ